METTGISLGDAMNLCNQNGGYNNWANNPFMYLIWLAWMGNNGFGGFGNNRAIGEMATQSDVRNIVDNSSVMNKLNGLSNGIADATFSLNNQGVQNTNNITNAIGTLGTQIMQGNFAVQQNLASIQSGMDRNCCDLKTAMHAEGEATRGLVAMQADQLKGMLTQNTIQGLRDKLAEKDNELQTANFQMSQMAQSANIINALKTTTTPA